MMVRVIIAQFLTTERPGKLLNKQYEELERFANARHTHTDPGTNR